LFYNYTEIIIKFNFRGDMSISEKTYRKIEVDPSARNAVLSGHPWIFSGKIKSSLNDYSNGEIVFVGCEGKFLGTGFVSPKNSIAVRMISRERVELSKHFFRKRFQDLNFMKRKFLSQDTDMYRLCFSESDFLPGLIVDIYGRIAVIQTNCAGMMNLREIIAETLMETLLLEGVIDRTDADTYKIEHFDTGLPSNLFWGREQQMPVVCMENGIKFYVDLIRGHKTGFYLDQRENREIIKKASTGVNVVNICSYTGGFSIYALSAGCRSVTSVDTSKTALSILQQNVELNDLSVKKSIIVAGDMFDYILNEDLSVFDIIIVDPPAFAKHTTERERAIGAYKTINSAIMKKAKRGALIFTSSCTSVVSMDMFAEIITKAIRDSRKDVNIVKRTSLPADHSSLVNFNETEYLKSFLLHVN